MATPTSSSNRSKRKGTKPITQGQNPQRSNRQKVSNAKVTNSSNRGGNSGSAKVTTGRGASAPKPADPWKAPTTKTSRTSAPKSNTTFRTGNTPITLPNSKKAGKNLPNAAAAKIRAKTKDVRPSNKPPVKPSGNFKAPSIPKPTAAPKPSAKPANTSLLRGSFGQGAGALQLGLMGAELATQAGYARGGKNYKEFVRAQDRVPAKPSAKPAAKPGKPALGSTGVRVSDKANQRDYKAAPTGSKQYNDYRNRQIAGERERLKNVGNPPKPKAKPPAPAADQRRSGGGGNNTAPRSQTPPAPRFTGTVDEGRKMWAEKYSSSKYDGQAIQKEAKKLLEKMKERKQDKSNAQRAGWDGNKNY